MSPRPVIMGELGLISLFDLAQLLLLNGATGTLHVQSAGRKGLLRFDRGQVADALDDRFDSGVEAAYRVFSWAQGSFEFRAGKPSGNGRRILDSTEGLMLEAARRMDESQRAATHEGDVTRALLVRNDRWSGMHSALARFGLKRTGSATPTGSTESPSHDAFDEDHREAA
ncbi:MAG: DUF4388 domain-containing protein [bacterium]